MYARTTLYLYGYKVNLSFDLDGMRLII